VRFSPVRRIPPARRSGAGPHELPPGAQLVKPEVERNAAQDVDRLALLVMAEPEPINGPDHLGLAALLHDSLDAGSGCTNTLAGRVVQRR
jgi:hypothetical protein